MPITEQFEELTINYRITELRNRIDELQKENTHIFETAKTGNQKTDEFVDYFQHELEKKEKLIEKLNEKAKQLEIDRDTKISNVNGTWTNKLSQEISRTETDLKLLEEKLESRQRVLDDILLFKRSKVDIDREIDEFKKILVEQKKVHQNNIKSIEKRRIDDLNKLQIDTENKISNIMYKIRKEIQKGVDADTRKIVSDNRRMGEELKFLIEHTIELQKIAMSFQQINSIMKAEIKNYMVKEELYSKDGVKKTQMNREMNDRKKRLIDQKKSFLETSQKQVDSLKNKYKTDMGKMKDRIIKMQELIKLKNKEISIIQFNGQIILNQRTQIEQEFITALSHVKNEFQLLQQQQYQEKINEFRDNLYELKKQSISHPKIDLYQNSAIIKPIQPTTNFSQSSLSWEDRIRVIRILFGQLNPSTSTILKDKSTEEDNQKLVQSQEILANNNNETQNTILSQNYVSYDGYDLNTKPDLC